MTKEEILLYDFLVEQEIATPQELNLARCLVAGSWKFVLESVLYVRTGNHDMWQYINEMMCPED